jgi:hypothetical protein
MVTAHRRRRQTSGDTTPRPISIIANRGGTEISPASRVSLTPSLKTAASHWLRLTHNVGNA